MPPISTPWQVVNLLWYTALIPNPNARCLMKVFERLGYEFGRGFCKALCEYECPPKDLVAVRGYFPGLQTINSAGEIVMAAQAIAINTAYTGAITFLNAEGQQIPSDAKTASVALDNTSAGSASLSADGQSVNVTLTVVGAVNLVYTGTNSAGNPITVPPLPLQGTDSVAVSGSIGTLSPGTTP